MWKVKGMGRSWKLSLRGCIKFGLAGRNPSEDRSENEEGKKRKKDTEKKIGEYEKQRKMIRIRTRQSRSGDRSYRRVRELGLLGRRAGHDGCENVINMARLRLILRAGLQSPAGTQRYGRGLIRRIARRRRVLWRIRIRGCYGDIITITNIRGWICTGRRIALGTPAHLARDELLVEMVLV